jgi:hypothetical protein
MMEESSEGVRDVWRGVDGSTGPGGVCGGDMDGVDESLKWNEAEEHAVTWSCSQYRSGSIAPIWYVYVQRHTFTEIHITTFTTGN